MRTAARLAPIILALVGATGACAALLHVDDVTYGADAEAEGATSDVALRDAAGPGDAADDGGEARDGQDRDATADATRPCSDGASEYPFCDDFDHVGLLQGWKQLIDSDASAALWPDQHVSPPNSARFALVVGANNGGRNILYRTFSTPSVTHRAELDMNVFHDAPPGAFQQLLHVEFAPDGNGNDQFQVVILVDEYGSIVAGLYDAVTTKTPAVPLGQSMPVKTRTWQHLHVTIDFDANELLVAFDGLFGKGKLDDGTDSGVPIRSTAPRLTFGLPNVLPASPDAGLARAAVAYDDLYFDVY